MKVSPFAPARRRGRDGEDLATTPSTSLKVQAAGDCHCLNFGGFATPERRLVFDINDFDETAVAPWEWDLKRLATSFVVATLDTLDKDARIDLANSAARRYRETMASIAEMPVLDAWYFGLGLDNPDKAAAIGVGAAALRKAVGFLTHAPIVSLSHRGGTEPRIEDAPPLVYHPPKRGAAFGSIKALPAISARSLSSRRCCSAASWPTPPSRWWAWFGRHMCSVLLMISGNRRRAQFKRRLSRCSRPTARPYKLTATRGPRAATAASRQRRRRP
jgi:hypothetical protein